MTYRAWTRKGGGKRRRAFRLKTAYSGRAGRLRAMGFRVTSRRQRLWHPGLDRTAGYYRRFGGAGAIELKFHDLDIDNGAISSTAEIVEDSCNGIQQGVTEVTRVGRKCTIRSINWRYRIEKTTTATEANGSLIVRVILYLDKQCNGATALATDILEDANYQSFNNLANKSRFRTLMDRTYDLNPSAAGNGTANDIMPLKVTDSLYKKVNIPIEFDGTTGAITEIRSNNIGVLMVADINDIATFDSKMRLRFSDSQ